MSSAHPGRSMSNLHSWPDCNICGEHSPMPVRDKSTACPSSIVLSGRTTRARKLTTLRGLILRSSARVLASARVVIACMTFSLLCNGSQKARPYAEDLETVGYKFREDLST